MSYKPKNKLISDIYYRVNANLPLQGRIREYFSTEWVQLEKRIEKYYEINDLGKKVLK